MALAPGSRLGPYEVVSPIGVGGMGEVYRARDPKLNRDVALKILPPEFALDPDRLARFKREAQVLASINHPAIAAIYGFEDSGHTHALVLESNDNDAHDNRIYLQPFPATGAKYEVGRGIHPVWTRDGKQILLIPAPGAPILAYAITTQPNVTFAPPVAFPRRPFANSSVGTEREFEPMPDGTILELTDTETDSGDSINEIRVVLNWTEELKARVPTK